MANIQKPPKLTAADWIFNLLKGSVGKFLTSETEFKYNNPEINKVQTAAKIININIGK